MNTRDSILNAAYSEFAKNGYYGTYIRSISKACGASLSAVPYYFGTKEHLFLEVVQMASQKAIDYLNLVPEDVEKALAGKISGKEAHSLLIQLINRHIDYVFDPDNEDTIQIIREAHTHPELIHESELTELFSHVTEPIRKLLDILTGNENSVKDLIWSQILIGEPLFFIYHKGFTCSTFSVDSYTDKHREMIRQVIVSNLEKLLPPV